MTRDRWAARKFFPKFVQPRSVGPPAASAWGTMRGYDVDPWLTDEQNGLVADVYQSGSSPAALNLSDSS